MTNESKIETDVIVKHVKVESTRSFESARQVFESVIPKLDPSALALLSEGHAERAKSLLESGPELSIFQSRDHGAVVRMAGLSRKALQYDVGNPLTASKMTRQRLSAALYAPFRVLLYENERGNAVFEYDKPSSLFGQFGDERVTEVARGLDTAIERALKHVDDT